MKISIPLMLVSELAVYYDQSEGEPQVRSYKGVKVTYDGRELIIEKEQHE